MRQEDRKSLPGKEAAHGFRFLSGITISLSFEHGMESFKTNDEQTVKNVFLTVFSFRYRMVMYAQKYL